MIPFARIKGMSYLLTFFLLTALLCFSCKKENKQVKMTPPPSTEQGCVIFLDTSVSIRGYFRTANYEATTVQKLLQAEIRNIIGERNLGPIYLSCFSSKVGQPQNIQGNIGRMFVFNSTSDLNAFFSGTSTDIIGVLNREEFKRYSAAILITDGIQADKTGFDIGEMVRAIKGKIDEGLHFYLIGIKSEFSGFIYPEHSNKEGLKIPLQHTGLRPVYIWIAAHDPKIGNTLAGQVVSKLKDIASNNPVKMVSLTDALLPKVDDLVLDTSSSEYEHKIKLIPRSQGTIEVKLANDLRGDVAIPVRFRKDSDDNEESEWEFRMKSEPENKWAKVIKTDEYWALSLISNRIPQHSFAIFGDGNNLKITLLVVPNRQQWWWRQWSTPDDSKPEDANKTLYLQKLGENLIEPIYNKNYIMRTLNLKIVR